MWEHRIGPLTVFGRMPVRREHFDLAVLPIQVVPDGPLDFDGIRRPFGRLPEPREV